MMVYHHKAMEYLEFLRREFTLTRMLLLTSKLHVFVEQRCAFEVRLASSILVTYIRAIKGVRSGEVLSEDTFTRAKLYCRYVPNCSRSDCNHLTCRWPTPYRLFAWRLRVYS
jgi:hypothetical protein